MHPFESAGLGIAPFQWIGIEYRVGPQRIDDVTTVGAPGQPTGCCAYCGQGIAECHLIRSSDGHTFTVGCVCVYKTDDKTLIDPADRAAKKLRKKLQKERNIARITAAEKTLDENHKLQDVLAARPHPSIDGKTELDWADWMLRHAGATGKLRVARVIEKMIKEV